MEQPSAEQQNNGQPSVDELKSQAQEAARLLRGVEEHLPGVVSSLPRRILADNLRLADPKSYTRLFKGFRAHKIPADRLYKYVKREVIDNDNVALAHMVVVLWNEAHRDIYEACKAKLEEKYPDVEAIEVVEEEFSGEVLRTLVDKFGADETALLCKLNEVRLHRDVLSKMLPDWDWTEQPQAKPAS